MRKIIMGGVIFFFLPGMSQAGEQPSSLPWAPAPAMAGKPAQPRLRPVFTASRAPARDDFPGKPAQSAC
jgi:hypothetical protein